MLTTLGGHEPSSDRRSTECSVMSGVNVEDSTPALDMKRLSIDKAKPKISELVVPNLQCPICLDIVQLPVNLICFPGCIGTRSKANNTCLRSCLCQLCANSVLQLDRVPSVRFPETKGITRCMICRKTPVDATHLNLTAAYHVNHTVMDVMDGLGMGGTCRACEADFPSQEDLQAHYLKSCPHAAMQCRFRGCTQVGLRSKVSQHEKTCSTGRTRCTECSDYVDKDMLMCHVATICRNRIVACIVCKHRARLPDMVHHLRLHKSELQQQVGSRRSLRGSEALPGGAGAQRHTVSGPHPQLYLGNMADLRSVAAAPAPAHACVRQPVSTPTSASRGIPPPTFLALSTQSEVRMAGQSAFQTPLANGRDAQVARSTSSGPAVVMSQHPAIVSPLLNQRGVGVPAHGRPPVDVASAATAVLVASRSMGRRTAAGLSPVSSAATIPSAVTGPLTALRDAAGVVPSALAVAQGATGSSVAVNRPAPSGAAAAGTAAVATPTTTRRVAAVHPVATVAASVDAATEGAAAGSSGSGAPSPGSRDVRRGARLDPHRYQTLLKMLQQVNSMHSHSRQQRAAAASGAEGPSSPPMTGLEDPAGPGISGYTGQQLPGSGSWQSDCSSSSGGSDAPGFPEEHVGWPADGSQGGGEGDGANCLGVVDEARDRPDVTGEDCYSKIHEMLLQACSGSCMDGDAQAQSDAHAEEDRKGGAQDDARPSGQAAGLKGMAAACGGGENADSQAEEADAVLLRSERFRRLAAAHRSSVYSGGRSSFDDSLASSRRSSKELYGTLSSGACDDSFVAVLRRSLQDAAVRSRGNSVDHQGQTATRGCLEDGRVASGELKEGEGVESCSWLATTDGPAFGAGAADGDASCVTAEGGRRRSVRRSISESIVSETVRLQLAAACKGVFAQG